MLNVPTYIFLVISKGVGTDQMLDFRTAGLEQWDEPSCVESELI